MADILSTIAFDTPVLLMVFNRPETTRVVFEEIRRRRPSQLYISCDGPREAHPTDADRVAAVREICANVDWECTVSRLYHENNLGCRYAPPAALDWFFQQVQEGIILEDDTVPSQSFFLFCQELLRRYRSDERVLMISGDNFQQGAWRGNGSYYFSNFYHLWGWATWRRAWALHDGQMRLYPEFRKQRAERNLPVSRAIKNYLINSFEAVYSKNANTWDYQWLFAVTTNNGLCVLPNLNLITNIGFGGDATHTKGDSFLSNLPRFEITQLEHPSFVIADREADDFTTELLGLRRRWSWHSLFDKPRLAERLSRFARLTSPGVRGLSRRFIGLVRHRRRDTIKHSQV